MKKVILTTFTDPMMGLSYESEPVFHRLEKHYGDRIEFRYVMAGLVRDVSDFMTTEEWEETERDPEKGIRLYCRRLAGIYKREESIGGLPINYETLPGHQCHSCADPAGMHMEHAEGIEQTLKLPGEAEMLPRGVFLL